ncbi:carboxymuconolactone decarboxylase family protein [Nocardioides deserti]|uniref:Carboxymuconolactone decarboxylase family protein n=1 Tax=Nocardioides deserti TaxID=1588644 RepID=A0ABR6U3J8_9ACTN|nr:carboxymuconolactone decarboxylase family protein [Nocardioides deserti]MBC2958955.1 carboxymuconolactone decarboxylase family protein [Nocardioides deserti]GGO69152.1 4-carboxymuconolactone decarboxylase [Nocardioides deserti]
MSTPRIAPGSLRDVGPFTWALARVFGRRSGTEPPAVFLVLGRHRRLFRGWLHFAGRMMPGGRLPRRDSEIVILRVAHLTGSEYEATQHRGLGRRAGLSDIEIDRVADGLDADGWSDRERLLLRVTDELYGTSDLSDATWADLRAELDEEACLELLLLVGHYQMLATTLRALRVPPDRLRR